MQKQFKCLCAVVASSLLSEFIIFGTWSTCGYSVFCYSDVKCGVKKKTIQNTTSKHPFLAKNNLRAQSSLNAHSGYFRVVFLSKILCASIQKSLFASSLHCQLCCKLETDLYKRLTQVKQELPASPAVLPPLWDTNHHANLCSGRSKGDVSTHGLFMCSNYFLNSKRNLPLSQADIYFPSLWGSIVEDSWGHFAENEHFYQEEAEFKSLPPCTQWLIFHFRRCLTTERGLQKCAKHQLY